MLGKETCTVSLFCIWTLKKGIDKLEQVQWRASKTVLGWSIGPGRRGRESRVLCIKGRLWSTSWQPAHTREGIAEKMEEAMLFV